MPFPVFKTIEIQALNFPYTFSKSCGGPQESSSRSGLWAAGRGLSTYVLQYFKSGARNNKSIGNSGRYKSFRSNVI